MNVSLVKRENTGELLLNGRLDFNTAPEVGEIFQSVAERFDRVILNLADMEYVSSAGLRIIKLLYMTMARKGGELVIKNANAMVMEVFEMTGFAGLLKFE